jgi:uncharacterized protein (DUF1778 family)
MLLFQKLGQLAPPNESINNVANDEIGKTFNNIGAAMSKKDPIISLCVFMYSQGGRLQAARAEGSTDHLLRVAAAITEATRLNFFALIAPTATTAVVEASLVQMKFIINTKQSHNWIIDDIKQNLTALKVVAARCELVEMIHGRFMAQLARFIEVYDAIESMDFTLLETFLTVT